ncbi:class I SAM-dependent methyltransferase [Actinocrispum wychmicini]|uniref:Putative O-methyltransferase YrrM n=1 Tax=Actinocrispum wychmicini TaxID=1213861 RepID=A0A4V2S6A9_9PSEU|nr:class I SAM-dependent methyltransferase [Actinocrispum wychmicini]TCO55000.1 putative O-methyltransferase YrrM [Actinocrispum wychmicini]
MHTNQGPLTVDSVVALYEKYLDDLRAVRTAQRALHGTGMKAQLDDIEAEITYLRMRAARPESVVEIGALHGWSTSWILHALRDNGSGQLFSYDVVDHARYAVPRDLATRWTFVHGDVRNALLPSDIGYLFVDAAHTAPFARWYTASVFSRITAGTPVSVHDVFHGRRAMPLSEGPVVLRWLQENNIPYFTSARKAAPDAYEEIMWARARLDLTEPIHSGTDNPMIFFTR